MNLDQRIKEAMVDVHDFPKPGIVYKDITPIFQDPHLLNDILDRMVEECRGLNLSLIHI